MKNAIAGFGILCCHHARTNFNKAIKYMTSDTEIRDLLALERTRLANERTFLAYIRTSLALFAGAAVLFQFFSSLHAYTSVAWVLGLGGLSVLLIGVYRFNHVRSRLKKYAPS
jgi:putative membrane protein